MHLSGLKNCKKIYFIGIGGISMSALAKLLFQFGYQVSGSDALAGEQTEALRQLGIKVYIGVDGMRAELCDADAVVYTDAISEGNQELVMACRLDKKVFSRAELLGLICECFSNVITVAGSHGKTTCTAMCAHVLKHLNTSFTAHLGGEDTLMGNFYSDGLGYFVTEACEYKKNLLKIPKNVAVLLNVDKDHMECYGDEEQLLDCFRQYCESATTTFVCGDDEKCRKIGEFPSFGIENPYVDYRAVDMRANRERYAFTVMEYGKAVARVRLNAIGRCNVYNALAAFSAIRSFGYDGETIARGLEKFTAVKRRFERIGDYHGATFICDYAHHPREISATVATAKGISNRNLYVVFQPHTYSRTKFLMEEFIEVLRPIKNLMIYKTYPAREKFDGAGSAERLAENVGNCLYAHNVYALKAWLQTTVREGDVVLFLGAGDIYYAAQYLLKN